MFPQNYQKLKKIATTNLSKFITPRKNTLFPAYFMDVFWWRHYQYVGVSGLFYDVSGSFYGHLCFICVSVTSFYIGEIGVSVTSFFMENKDMKILIMCGLYRTALHRIFKH